MKTLLNATLITTALFTSQAFANSLNDVGTHSTESNLAQGATHSHSYTPTSNPLADLGRSVEAHLADGQTIIASSESSPTVFALEPTNSKEALL